MTDKTKNPGETSFKQTSAGIIPRSELIKMELKGVKLGLEFIHAQFKRKKSVEITPSLILKLHKTSFGWIFPDWAGKFRTINVTYSGKEAPPYYQVRELVTNLCDDLELRLKKLPNKNNEKFIDEVVNLLAWFQHKFVFIHPFRDYNGRAARMLTSLLMIKLGLPANEIKIVKKSDREKYLEAMQKADNGELSQLEKLISNSIEESLSNF